MVQAAVATDSSVLATATATSAASRSAAISICTPRTTSCAAANTEAALEPRVAASELASVNSQAKSSRPASRVGLSAIINTNASIWCADKRDHDLVALIRGLRVGANHWVHYGLAIAGIEPDISRVLTGHAVGAGVEIATSDRPGGLSGHHGDLTRPGIGLGGHLARLRGGRELQGGRELGDFTFDSHVGGRDVDRHRGRRGGDRAGDPHRCFGALLGRRVRQPPAQGQPDEVRLPHPLARSLLG